MNGEEIMKFGHAKSLHRASEQISVMLDALEQGATVPAAAAYARLQPRTVHEWIARGRVLLEEYTDESVEPMHHERMLMQLAVQVDGAVGGVEVEAVRAITEAGKDGDWRAYAWLLERRFRDKWAQRVENTGVEGGAVVVDVKTQRQEVEAALGELNQKLAQIEGGKDEYRVEAVEVEGEDVD